MIGWLLKIILGVAFIKILEDEGIKFLSPGYWKITICMLLIVLTNIC